MKRWRFQYQVLLPALIEDEMAFQDIDWNTLFPGYLTSGQKDRLKAALEQFRPAYRGNRISYSDFYKPSHAEFRNFMQGDLVRDMRLPIWDDVNAVYGKGYSNALILTNTCDISKDNARPTNSKECLLAPLANLSDYVAALKGKHLPQAQIDSFVTALKNQEITNLFFLPPCPSSHHESIAVLDKVFWINTGELNELVPTIEEDRIASLNHYGYYLFLLKLSHNLCRFPETDDRCEATMSKL